VKAVKQNTELAQANEVLKRAELPKICEIVFEGFINAGNKADEEQPAGPRITPRELEIIRLLAQGKSNKELSTQLGITVRTVETHRSKIMLKPFFSRTYSLCHAQRNNLN
jgi:DNA-binding NarL/FixJ family response regulator